MDANVWEHFLCYLGRFKSNQPNTLHKNALELNSLDVPTDGDSENVEGMADLLKHCSLKETKSVIVLSSDSETDDDSIWSNNAKCKSYKRICENVHALVFHRILGSFYQCTNSTLFPYEKLKILSEDLRKFQQVFTHNEEELKYLWRNVVQWLLALKQSSDPTELKYDENFILILTDFMVQYVNYVTSTFYKMNEPAKVNETVNEIVQTLTVVLGGSNLHILLVLLRIDLKIEYRSILNPIFRKYLCDHSLCHASSDLVVYLRLILCFKRWKMVTPLKADREAINELAVGKSTRSKKAECSIDLIDLTTEPILPKSVPKVNAKNRLFISISDLIGFAMEKEAYGTRILLIYTSLDLEDAISKYFQFYKRYVSLTPDCLSMDVEPPTQDMSELNLQTEYYPISTPRNYNDATSSRPQRRRERKNKAQQLFEKQSKDFTPHLNSNCYINKIRLSNLSNSNESTLGLKTTNAQSDTSLRSKNNSFRDNLEYIHIDLTDSDDDNDEDNDNENDNDNGNNNNNDNDNDNENDNDDNDNDDNERLKKLLEKADTETVSPQNLITNENALGIEPSMPRIAAVPPRCRHLVESVATKPTRKEKHCIPGEVSSTTSSDYLLQTNNAQNIRTTLEHLTSPSAFQYNVSSLEVHSAGTLQNAREVGVVKVLQQRVSPCPSVVVSGTCKPGSLLLGVNTSDISENEDDNDLECNSHIMSHALWKVVEEATSSTAEFPKTLPENALLLTPRGLAANTKTKELEERKKSMDGPICSKYVEKTYTPQATSMKALDIPRAEEVIKTIEHFSLKTKAVIQEHDHEDTPIEGKAGEDAIKNSQLLEYTQKNIDLGSDKSTERNKMSNNTTMLENTIKSISSIKLLSEVKTDVIAIKNIETHSVKCTNEKITLQKHYDEEIPPAEINVNDATIKHSVEVVKPVPENENLEVENSISDEQTYLDKKYDNAVDVEATDIASFLKEIDENLNESVLKDNSSYFNKTDDKIFVKNNNKGDNSAEQNLCNTQTNSNFHGDDFTNETKNNSEVKNHSTEIRKKDELAKSCMDVKETDTNENKLDAHKSSQNIIKETIEISNLEDGNNQLLDVKRKENEDKPTTEEGDHSMVKKSELDSSLKTYHENVNVIMQTSTNMDKNTDFIDLNNEIKLNKEIMDINKNYDQNNESVTKAPKSADTSLVTEPVILKTVPILNRVRTLNTNNNETDDLSKHFNDIEKTEQENVGIEASQVLMSNTEGVIDNTICVNVDMTKDDINGSAECINSEVEGLQDLNLNAHISINPIEDYNELANVSVEKHLNTEPKTKSLSTNEINKADNTNAGDINIFSGNYGVDEKLTTKSENIDHVMKSTISEDDTQQSGNLGILNTDDTPEIVKANAKTKEGEIELMPGDHSEKISEKNEVEKLDPKCCRSVKIKVLENSECGASRNSENISVSVLKNVSGSNEFELEISSPENTTKEIEKDNVNKNYTGESFINLNVIKKSRVELRNIEADVSNICTVDTKENKTLARVNDESSNRSQKEFIEAVSDHITRAEISDECTTNLNESADINEEVVPEIIDFNKECSNISKIKNGEFVGENIYSEETAKVAAKNLLESFEHITLSDKQEILSSVEETVATSTLEDENVFAAKQNDEDETKEEMKEENNSETKILDRVDVLEFENISLTGGILKEDTINDNIAQEEGSICSERNPDNQLLKKEIDLKSQNNFTQHIDFQTPEKEIQQINRKSNKTIKTYSKKSARVKVESSNKSKKEFIEAVIDNITRAVFSDASTTHLNESAINAKAVPEIIEFNKECSNISKIQNEEFVGENTKSEETSKVAAKNLLETSEHITLNDKQEILSSVEETVCSEQRIECDLEHGKQLIMSGNNNATLTLEDESVFATKQNDEEKEDEEIKDGNKSETKILPLADVLEEENTSLTGKVSVEGTVNDRGTQGSESICSELIHDNQMLKKEIDLKSHHNLTQHIDFQTPEKEIQQVNRTSNETIANNNKKSAHVNDESSNKSKKEFIEAVIDNITRAVFSDAITTHLNESDINEKAVPEIIELNKECSKSEIQNEEFVRENTDSEETSKVAVKNLLEGVEHISLSDKQEILSSVEETVGSEHGKQLIISGNNNATSTLEDENVFAAKQNDGDETKEEMKEENNSETKILDRVDVSEFENISLTGGNLKEDTINDSSAQEEGSICSEQNHDNQMLKKEIDLKSHHNFTQPIEFQTSEKEIQQIKRKRNKTIKTYSKKSGRVNDESLNKNKKEVIEAISDNITRPVFSDESTTHLNESDINEKAVPETIELNTECSKSEIENEEFVGENTDSEETSKVAAKNLLEGVEHLSLSDKQEILSSVEETVGSEHGKQLIMSGNNNATSTLEDENVFAAKQNDGDETKEEMKEENNSETKILDRVDVLEFENISLTGENLKEDTINDRIAQKEGSICSEQNPDNQMLKDEIDLKSHHNFTQHIEFQTPEKEIQQIKRKRNKTIKTYSKKSARVNDESSNKNKKEFIEAVSDNITRPVFSDESTTHLNESDINEKEIPLIIDFNEECPNISKIQHEEFEGKNRNTEETSQVAAKNLLEGVEHITLSDNQLIKCDSEYGKHLIMSGNSNKAVLMIEDESVFATKQNDEEEKKEGTNSEPKILTRAEVLEDENASLAGKASQEDTVTDSSTQKEESVCIEQNHDNEIVKKEIDLKSHHSFTQHIDFQTSEKEIQQINRKSNKTIKTYIKKSARLNEKSANKRKNEYIKALNENITRSEFSDASTTHLNESDINEKAVPEFIEFNKDCSNISKIQNEEFVGENTNSEETSKVAAKNLLETAEHITLNDKQEILSSVEETVCSEERIECDLEHGKQLIMSGNNNATLALEDESVFATKQNDEDEKKNEMKDGNNSQTKVADVLEDDTQHIDFQQPEKDIQQINRDSKQTELLVEATVLEPPNTETKTLEENMGSNPHGCAMFLNDTMHTEDTNIDIHDNDEVVEKHGFSSTEEVKYKENINDESCEVAMLKKGRISLIITDKIVTKEIPKQLQEDDEHEAIQTILKTREIGEAKENIEDANILSISKDSITNYETNRVISEVQVCSSDQEEITNSVPSSNVLENIDYDVNKEYQRIDETTKNLDFEKHSLMKNNNNEENQNEKRLVTDTAQDNCRISPHGRGTPLLDERDNVNNSTQESNVFKNLDKNIFTLNILDISKDKSHYNTNVTNSLIITKDVTSSKDIQCSPEDDIEKRTPWKMRIKRRISLCSDINKEFNLDSNEDDKQILQMNDITDPEQRITSHTVSKVPVELADELNIKRMKDNSESDGSNAGDGSDGVQDSWLNQLGLLKNTTKNIVSPNDNITNVFMQKLDEKSKLQKEENFTSDAIVSRSLNQIPTNYKSEEIAAVSALLHMQNKCFNRTDADLSEQETINEIEALTSSKGKRGRPRKPMTRQRSSSRVNTAKVIELKPILKSALRKGSLSKSSVKKKVTFDTNSVVQLDKNNEFRKWNKALNSLKAFRSAEGSLLKGGNKQTKKRLDEINARFKQDSISAISNGEDSNEIITVCKPNNSTEIVSVPEQQSQNQKLRRKKVSNIITRSSDISHTGSTMLSRSASKSINRNKKLIEGDVAGNVYPTTISPKERNVSENCSEAQKTSCEVKVLNSASNKIFNNKANITTEPTTVNDQLMVKDEPSSSRKAPEKHTKLIECKDTDAKILEEKRQLAESEKNATQKVAEKVEIVDVRRSKRKRAVVRVQRLDRTKSDAACPLNDSETVEMSSHFDEKKIKKEPEDIEPEPCIDPIFNELDVVIKREEDCTVANDCFMTSPNVNPYNMTFEETNKANKSTCKEIIVRPCDVILTEEIINAQATQFTDFRKKRRLEITNLLSSSSSHINSRNSTVKAKISTQSDLKNVLKVAKETQKTKIKRNEKIKSSKRQEDSSKLVEETVSQHICEGKEMQKYTEPPEMGKENIFQKENDKKTSSNLKHIEEEVKGTFDETSKAIVEPEESADKITEDVIAELKLLSPQNVLLEQCQSDIDPKEISSSNCQAFEVIPPSKSEYIYIEHANKEENIVCKDKEQRTAELLDSAIERVLGISPATPQTSQEAENIDIAEINQSQPPKTTKEQLDSAIEIVLGTSPVIPQTSQEAENIHIAEIKQPLPPKTTKEQLDSAIEIVLGISPVIPQTSQEAENIDIAEIKQPLPPKTTKEQLDSAIEIVLGISPVMPQTIQEAENMDIAEINQLQHPKTTTEQLDSDIEKVLGISPVIPQTNQEPETIDIAEIHQPQHPKTTKEQLDSDIERVLGISPAIPQTNQEPETIDIAEIIQPQPPKTTKEQLDSAIEIVLGISPVMPQTSQEAENMDIAEINQPEPPKTTTEQLDSDIEIVLGISPVMPQTIQKAENMDISEINQPQPPKTTTEQLDSDIEKVLGISPVMPQTNQEAENMDTAEINQPQPPKTTTEQLDSDIEIVLGISPVIPKTNQEPETIDIAEIHQPQHPKTTKEQLDSDIERVLGISPVIPQTNQEPETIDIAEIIQPQPPKTTTEQLDSDIERVLGISSVISQMNQEEENIDIAEINQTQAPKTTTEQLDSDIEKVLGISPVIPKTNQDPETIDIAEIHQPQHPKTTKEQLDSDIERVLGISPVIPQTNQEPETIDIAEIIQPQPPKTTTEQLDSDIERVLGISSVIPQTNQDAENIDIADVSRPQPPKTTKEQLDSDIERVLGISPVISQTNQEPETIDIAEIIQLQPPKTTTEQLDSDIERVLGISSVISQTNQETKNIDIAEISQPQPPKTTTEQLDSDIERVLGISPIISQRNQVAENIDIAEIIQPQPPKTTTEQLDYAIDAILGQRNNIKHNKAVDEREQLKSSDITRPITIGEEQCSNKMPSENIIPSEFEQNTIDILNQSVETVLGHCSSSKNYVESKLQSDTTESVFKRNVSKPEDAIYESMKVMNKKYFTDMKTVSANVPEALFADDDSDNSNSESDADNLKFFTPILSLDDLLTKKTDEIFEIPSCTNDSDFSCDQEPPVAFGSPEETRQCLVTPNFSVELEVATSRSVNESANKNISDLSSISDIIPLGIPIDLIMTNETFADVMDIMLLDQVQQSIEYTTNGTLTNQVEKTYNQISAPASSQKHNVCTSEILESSSSANNPCSDAICIDQEILYSTINPLDEVEVSTNNGFDLHGNVTVEDLLADDGDDLFAFSELDKTRSRSNSYLNDSESCSNSPQEVVENLEITTKAIACDHSYNKEIKNPECTESVPNMFDSKLKLHPSPFWKVLKNIKTSTPKRDNALQEQADNDKVNKITGDTSEALTVTPEKIQAYNPLTQNNSQPQQKWHSAPHGKVLKNDVSKTTLKPDSALIEHKHDNVNKKVCDNTVESPRVSREIKLAPKKLFNNIPEPELNHLRSTSPDPTNVKENSIITPKETDHKKQNDKMEFVESNGNSVTSKMLPISKTESSSLPILLKQSYSPSIITQPIITIQSQTNRLQRIDPMSKQDQMNHEFKELSATSDVSRIGTSFRDQNKHFTKDEDFSIKETPNISLKRENTPTLDEPPYKKHCTETSKKLLTSDAIFNILKSKASVNRVAYKPSLDKIDTSNDSNEVVLPCSTPNIEKVTESRKDRPSNEQSYAESKIETKVGTPIRNLCDKPSTESIDELIRQYAISKANIPDMKSEMSALVGKSVGTSHKKDDQNSLIEFEVKYAESKELGDRIVETSTKSDKSLPIAQRNKNPVLVNKDYLTRSSKEHAKTFLKKVTEKSTHIPTKPKKDATNKFISKPSNEPIVLSPKLSPKQSPLFSVTKTESPYNEPLAKNNSTPSPTYANNRHHPYQNSPNNTKDNRNKHKYQRVPSFVESKPPTNSHTSVATLKKQEPAKRTSEQKPHQYTTRSSKTFDPITPLPHNTASCRSSKTPPITPLPHNTASCSKLVVDNVKLCEAEEAELAAVLEEYKKTLPKARVYKEHREQTRLLKLHEEKLRIEFLERKKKYLKQSQKLMAEPTSLKRRSYDNMTYDNSYMKPIYPPASNAPASTSRHFQHHSQPKHYPYIPHIPSQPTQSSHTGQKYINKFGEIEKNIAFGRNSTEVQPKTPLTITTAWEHRSASVDEIMEHLAKMKKT